MTTPKPQKPLTKRGRVLIWIMIVFVFIVGTAGGAAVISEGLHGRDAMADGPAGTLTPTTRECGRDSCSWIGEFVSEDATITRSGVLLRGAERVGHGDPMPARIDDVRLHDDPGQPAAYTADYNSGRRIAAGVFLIAVGLVIGSLLVRNVRRYKRPAEPAGSDTSTPAQP